MNNDTAVLVACVICGSITLGTIAAILTANL